MASLPSAPPLIIWRLSNFADISGRGGLVASGRWHTRPNAVVYCADDAHTALCEMVRQFGAPFLMPDDYKLLKIKVPSSAKVDSVNPEDLDCDWSADGSLGWRICRPLGDAWLQSIGSPLLKVPSAARIGNYNYLINPVHRMADDIEILEVIDQPFPDYCIKGTPTS